MCCTDWSGTEQSLKQADDVPIPVGATGLHFVEHYFAVFLAARMNIPLIPGYDTFSVSADICFSDSGDIWRVVVESGQIVELSRVHVPASKVRYSITVPVFEEIVCNRLSPSRAFFERKTRIEGNLVDGLRFARILGLFFHQHPYVAGTHAEEDRDDGDRPRTEQSPEKRG